jgi:hypothetical protein
MKNKTWFKYFIISYLLVLSKANAQTLEISIDRNSLKIGEQTNLTLKAEIPKSIRSTWPLFTDSINGMEIVKIGKIDTVSKSKTIQLTQNIVITSFDSGVFVIQPIALYSTSDSIISNALAIKFTGLQIDTTLEIKDIKSVIEVPFDYLTLWPYLFLALIIIALIIYFIRRKKKTSVLQRIEIVIPPYEDAMNKLNKLKAEKAWESENIKQYYTELSEVIREFIEKERGIIALEETTDKILKDLQFLGKDSSNYLKIKLLLIESDLVKFAKSEPSAYTGQNYLEEAFEIIKALKKKETNENS